MKRQFCDAYSFRTFLYNLPDRLLCHTVAPDVARLVYLAEDAALVNISSFQPLVQFRDGLAVVGLAVIRLERGSRAPVAR